MATRKSRKRRASTGRTAKITGVSKKRVIKLTSFKKG